MLHRGCTTLSSRCHRAFTTLSLWLHRAFTTLSPRFYRVSPRLHHAFRRHSTGVFPRVFASPITQRFVMSHLPGAKHLVPGRTCPRPNPAMGSFGFWEMPQCSGNGCQRWCTYVADDFGPICSVCQQYYVNKCKLQCLQNLIPQLRAPMLPKLQILVMDFLRGDGREDDCECEQCERHWFDQGWICPGEWMRH